MLERRGDVVRSPLPLTIALTLVACGPSETPPGDPVAALVADLQASEAIVRELGGFNSDPLGGRGLSLCIDGQRVRVYVYQTERQREAASSRIDPADPTHIGTAIIEWAGSPKFWQRERLMVLYLGTAPAVEASLTSVLGQPFARGQGRDPGPAHHAC